jgi:hypothetical protein
MPARLNSPRVGRSPWIWKTCRRRSGRHVTISCGAHGGDELLPAYPAGAAAGLVAGGSSRTVILADGETLVLRSGHLKPHPPRSTCGLARCGRGGPPRRGRAPTLGLRTARRPACARPDRHPDDAETIGLRLGAGQWRLGFRLQPADRAGDPAHLPGSDVVGPALVSELVELGLR